MISLEILMPRCLMRASERQSDLTGELGKGRRDEAIGLPVPKRSQFRERRDSERAEPRPDDRRYPSGRDDTPRDEYLACGRCRLVRGLLLWRGWLLRRGLRFGGGVGSGGVSQFSDFSGKESFGAVGRSAVSVRSGRGRIAVSVRTGRESDR
ncbi:hypothetical protein AXG93_2637s1140 [Marchantia polymorpha subsp. ruderalis]|uniref:Uncharacterized protein n=1 Tax=Marchantia polymorpha subsp. ruderalis TaxID=1480154 RepID=A0A176VGU1_MARPO|nr:hypothetical protein AXG93_2637s1140 [Marchantia polymorpha subsp. ruderalis]